MNTVPISPRTVISYAVKWGIPFGVWSKDNGNCDIYMIRISLWKKSPYRTNTRVRRKKEIQKSRTMGATAMDLSRKVNHLSKVIWDGKIMSSPVLSVPEKVKQSLRWLFKSPKRKKLADGLIERTSSVSIKTEHKDEGDWWRKK